MTKPPIHGDRCRRCGCDNALVAGPRMAVAMADSPLMPIMTHCQREQVADLASLAGARSRGIDRTLSAT
jgi:hypothetical protein